MGILVQRVWGWAEILKFALRSNIPSYYGCCADGHLAQESIQDSHCQLTGFQLNNHLQPF